jgi:hypothetical protein
MNTKTAALKISEDKTFNVIDQLTLNNGGTYTRNIQSSGSQPLKVTICWTDVPGTPVSAQLDPSNAMLVNDLDLRITNTQSTFYPWKLNRDNPANPATNSAENNVDNVEVVYIASPAAGSYTITVDHDGTLSGGSQAFSIIISGAVALGNPPSCTTPVNPQPGATNVPVNTSLSWQAVTGATGYILYLGTDNPPSNLVNGANLGNVTTYTPSPALAYNTTHYWKVVPYNDAGQATGCSVWSFTTENSPYIIPPYTESFESGLGQWQQATDDNFNWTRWSGDTPTAKTGPKKAHDGTYYIYTEASPPQAPGQEASLEASFTFAGMSNPELSLWYHMYGNQMGTLHVDVFNGTWTNNVWSLSGQKQTTEKAPYRNAVINLISYANQVGVKIRIRGTIGSGEKSDMAVDLVSVRQKAAKASMEPTPGTTKQDDNNTVNQKALNVPGDQTEIFASDGVIHIRNASGDNIEGRVSIYNGTGQVLQVIELDGASSYLLNPVLRPGIYIIRLASGTTIISRKILIY